MKRTLIAAAVFVAASGSALATSPNVYLFNATLVGEEIGVEGMVGLFGCVQVSSTAGAVINNNQMVNVNASLDPQAQSYRSGDVTTITNNNTASIKGAGTAFLVTTESHSARSSSSQGAEASASYAYGNHSASVAGGGYHLSQQAASVESAFTHTSESSGGHIAAGGAIGGGYSSQESSYANTSAAAGGFQATEASGRGKVWTYQANEGSGFAAIGEHASAYETSSASATDAYGAAWGVDASLATTDVTTQGSLTEHTNTQVAGTLTATTGADAAKGVSGNLGINVAEGISNAQSNDVSLASVDIGNVFGNAQIFSTQSTAGEARINNFNLNASIGDGSLSGVTGNVGVNVASGIGNVQNNSLAGAVTTTSPGNALTTAMVATDDNSQTAGMTVRGQFQGTAMLGANTLANATGNIGVNIAGGAGNLQHNGLAIAALNSGH